jgi:hypothetical protein
LNSRTMVCQTDGQVFETGTTDGPGREVQLGDGTKGEIITQAGYICHKIPIHQLRKTSLSL